MSVAVFEPNVVLAIVAAGFWKLLWFQALMKSPRTWSRNFSVIAMFFTCSGAPTEATSSLKDKRAAFLMNS
jgi:hypothetical protein